jgi:hypothetical protein
MLDKNNVYHLRQETTRPILVSLNIYLRLVFSLRLPHTEYRPQPWRTAYFTVRLGISVTRRILFQHQDDHGGKKEEN